MYKPRDWPSLAEKIAAIFAGDGAPLLNALQSGLNLSDTTSPQSTQAAIFAVQCVDGPGLYGKFTPDQAIDEVVDWTLKTWETSTTMFTSLGIDFQCFSWKKRESERYTGPFNTTGLANPILVIGNTADVSDPTSCADESLIVSVSSLFVLWPAPRKLMLLYRTLAWSFRMAQGYVLVRWHFSRTSFTHELSFSTALWPKLPCARGRS